MTVVLFGTLHTVSTVQQKSYLGTQKIFEFGCSLIPVAWPVDRPTNKIRSWQSVFSSYLGNLIIVAAGRQGSDGWVQL